MTHIDWTYWLTHYGYLAVLVGTFLEGESILVAGAIAAHRGYLQLEWVLAAALFGSFFGDQLWFLIGRVYGRSLLLSRPRWQAQVKRVHYLLHRYHAAFILGFRFLYGLRTVSPFVLGTSPVPARRFLLLNFLGALLWTVSIGGLGYSLGRLSWSDLISPTALWTLGGAVLIASAVAGVVTWRRR